MRFLLWVKKLFVPSHHNAYRPHLLRKTSLMFLLAVALLAEGALVFNLMAREGGHAFLAAVIQSEIISLTNSQRQQNKVPVVAENKLLNQSAQAKADDMAKLGYFSHNGPDGKEPWKWIDASGYDYQYAGENLAVRFIDSKDVLAGWMASPTHRANTVKRVYSEVGVGIAQGVYKGEPATFVVQHFAKPSTQAMAARSRAAVLGAEIGPSSSFSDSLARNLGKLVSEPRESTAWILGSIIALLMLALTIAFFHHVQIQARDLLLPGTLVVGVALTMLVINSNFLSANITAVNQQAGVAGYKGVVLTPEAASLER